MTTPDTTTTTTDAGTAASPALGADPALAADDVAAVADPQAPAVDPSGPPPATVAVYKDGEGRVHYASPFSKATRDRVAAETWAEVDPADVDEPAELFDPTQHLVREVVAHLEQHADDEDEVARIKAADSRPTIRDWAPGDSE